jgi:hypothetical protein
VLVPVRKRLPTPDFTSDTPEPLSVLETVKLPLLA